MTRVLVGVLGNEAARYSEFWGCMMQLKTPEGSVKDIRIGSDYVGAQNELVQRCLDERFEFLWIMGDDHTFEADLLERLLASAAEHDLPVLVPLCTTRRAPFHLVTYGRNPDETNPDPYLPISLEGLPGEGIIEIEAAGSAGMLIRRDVLEAMESPWFQMTRRSEDILFCDGAKAAGFKVYADLSCRLGHIITAVVTPGFADGGWVTGVTLGLGGLQMAIGTAEQLLTDEENLPPAVDPRNQDDNPHPDAEPVDWRAAMEEGKARARPLESPAVPEAERIEIWVDDEFMWWWRAIGHDGTILRKDSGINEMTVIGAAHLFYPGVGVHQVQREVDDSRNLRQYNVPGRMFDR